MNERDFQKYIKEITNNLTLEQQEKLLNKLHYNWIPTIHNNFNNKILRKYVKCKSCGKFTSKKNLKEFQKYKIIKDEVVYTDSAYGEFDEIADVTYLITYFKCPYCKRHIEKSRSFYSEENRRERYS